MRQDSRSHVLRHHAMNNIAKNMIDFSVTISRERLRLNYINPSAELPKKVFSFNERIEYNRGVRKHESQAEQQKEVDCEKEI